MRFDQIVNQAAKKVAPNDPEVGPETAAPQSDADRGQPNLMNTQPPLGAPTIGTPTPAPITSPTPPSTREPLFATASSAPPAPGGDNGAFASAGASHADISQANKATEGPFFEALPQVNVAAGTGVTAPVDQPASGATQERTPASAPPAMTAAHATAAHAIDNDNALGTTNPHDEPLRAVREDLTASAALRAAAPKQKLSMGYLALWGALVILGVGYLATIALVPGAKRTDSASQLAVTKQVDALKAELKRLSAELKSTRKSLTARNGDVASLRKRINTLNNDQRALNGRIATLETSTTTTAATVKQEITPKPVATAPKPETRVGVTRPVAIPPAPVARRGPVPERPPLRRRAPELQLTAQQKLERLVAADQARDKTIDRVPTAPGAAVDPLSGVKLTPLPLIPNQPLPIQ